MLKTKKLLILLLLLSVLLGASWAMNALYESRDKARDTSGTIPVSSYDQTNSNLKGYVNSSYGYSIAYPDDWAYREYPGTGTGAGFRPAGSPAGVSSEPISIDHSTRGTDYCSIPFDEYVKNAAVYETQDFEKLNTITPLTSIYGVKGYTTTWIYTHTKDGSEAISGPITYFVYPNPCESIEVTLNDTKYLGVYNQMIQTFMLTSMSARPNLEANDNDLSTIDLASVTMQPATIKSITKVSGGWNLTLDYLSYNTDWLPGVDSTGPFFLNQNPKIRTVLVSDGSNTPPTTYRVCGANEDNTNWGPFVNTKIADFITDAERLLIIYQSGQESYEPTYYFTINNAIVTKIDQQCLP